jgi:hypothetical protein
MLQKHPSPYGAGRLTRTSRAAGVLIGCPGTGVFIYCDQGSAAQACCWPISVCRRLVGSPGGSRHFPKQPGTPCVSCHKAQQRALFAQKTKLACMVWCANVGSWLGVAARLHPMDSRRLWLVRRLAC